MRTAVCLFVLSLAAVHAQEQAPRLPAPAESPSTSEAEIRRARQLHADRNYRESAAAWQVVGAREPALATLAQRESVRALLAAGDLQPALTGLSVLGSAAPAELLLLAANACRDSKDIDCASSLYRRARESAGRTNIADDAALGLGRMLEGASRLNEALDVYRELQLTFRQASAFDEADGAARRLAALLPKAAPLSESDYDAIVDRLARVAAFRRAVDMELEWLTRYPDSSRKVEVEAAIVQHLYSLRANEEGRTRAEAFLKQHPDSDEAHEVAIVLFRLDVREGRTSDVEARGRAILSGDVAGVELSDRQAAGRLLAEYLVSVGAPAKAHAVYDELLKLTTARAGRLDVLWRMAIASLRTANTDRAVRELEQALSLRPDSETERAVSYWLAYAQQASGAKGAAAKRWGSLAAQQPFSYYGLRAAARIGTSLPSPTLTFPELTLSEKVTSHADYQAAQLLSRAGWLSEAAVFARRLSGAFRRDDAVALLAARASEAAGDHTSSSTLMSAHFGDYLQRPSRNLPSDFWTLAYPRAYWPQVSAAAGRAQVDPLLMLGISRQESHFDRTARSPVGAVGLFQVMPYTAVEIDPSFSAPGALERLTDAGESAELAAKLLAKLSALYAGALAPTIASYNADKERVQIWWESAKGLPEELFIDSIPYQQTRAYVRQVLTNYEMYRRSSQSASPQK